MDWSESATFVRSVTRVTRSAFVPELRLRVALELMPTWEATQRRDGGHAAPPPFWAFAWPGSLALARYVLDNPPVVQGRRVLDFAAGCGLAAIAAMRAGAARVVACDVDPLAAVAQQVNAQLNDVTLPTLTADLVGQELPEDIDVVLIGDVCYERQLADSVTPWLRELAAGDRMVLLADPGRTYVPSAGVEQVVQYDVPTTRELEREERMRTTIWRVLPG